MIETNTSHLAGEFLVAGELSRRGYPVSITMGNAKAIDIHADTMNRKETIRIDAKATRSKTSWPINKNSVDPGIFYIFVNLRSEEEIKKNTKPEYFIVIGTEIFSNNLIKPWKSMPGISYSSLKKEDYEERWDKLPPCK